MAKRIVLVASDRKTARLVGAALQDAGHETLLAADGASGVRLARKEQPDLVMVDYELKGIEGTEVCERLRKDPATDHLRLLLLADENRLEDLVIGQGATADDYLIKPFTSQDPITKIGPLLTGSDDQITISTGNGELDDKMGGIPMGSLTLIEGDSGAGKSVLSQQMIHGSLGDRFKVSLFTSENTVKSLLTQMRSLNLDILDSLLLDFIRVYPIETSRLGDDAAKVLANAMKTQKQRDMIFVDSLTSSIPQASDKQVLAFFEECKSICADGTTVIIIVHSHGMSSELLTRIRSLCDAHFQLRTEEVGDRLVKTLEATKVRGAKKTTGNIVSFDVEPGWGMRVVPINRVRG